MNAIRKSQFSEAVFSDDQGDMCLSAIEHISEAAYALAFIQLSIFNDLQSIRFAVSLLTLCPAYPIIISRKINFVKL